MLLITLLTATHFAQRGCYNIFNLFHFMPEKSFLKQKLL